MKLFSERYGYIKPSDTLIIECMPKEVQNSIYNCLYEYKEKYEPLFESLDKRVWVYFLNEKECDYGQFQFKRGYLSLHFIDDSERVWHQKLSLIEFLLDLLEKTGSIYQKKMPTFVDSMNRAFERLNYGYRIIDNIVTPITSQEEISCIEESINSAKDNIKEHLNSALKHLADKEKPDYRNSIKESISAIEALCREKTNSNTLGSALKELEKSGIQLHPALKSSFEKLYVYTNDEKTGVRHALMDDTSDYSPTYHEAKFMLVSCTAFINYLNGKFV